MHRQTNPTMIMIIGPVIFGGVATRQVEMEAGPNHLLY